MKIDVSFVYESESLIDINMKSIEWCMNKLKIEKPIVFASELAAAGSKSELLANIIRTVGGTEYISGPSGKDYLDMKWFDGIDVSYFSPVVDNYYSALYNIMLEKLK